MKLKRILSGIIGLPIVALILIYSNIYVIDVVFAIVALIAMKEYLNYLDLKIFSYLIL